jgi:hypothetical protein
MTQGARSSNDSKSTYTDPETPFYIVAGGAGSDEGLDETMDGSGTAPSQSSTSTVSSTIDPTNPGLAYASKRTQRRAAAGSAGSAATTRSTAGSSAWEKQQVSGEQAWDWTAFVDTSSYGTGVLHVLNRTHLRWEYIESSTGDVLDQVSIVQHAHAL